jgi:UDP-N-acetylmuramoyl-L-alanyl-D-glutamate--2,6-diaminopimelate ligase
VRAAMAVAAARFHGDPTARLPVVGITGTNGKTTTAFLVRSLRERAGKPCGLVGTVTSVVAGVERPVVRTTPEAIDLQRTFHEMLDGGDRACAMEVSSHALELRRTEGIHFAVAVFTNLTQDHLDFHPTMEDYFQAKRWLFASSLTDVRVANVDDPYGRRLADEFGSVTFAIDRPADYRAVDVRTGLAGSECAFETPDGAFPLTLPLPGRFNVANALAAWAAARALGVEPGVLVAALADAPRVPGRFEPVVEGQPFAVLVDYAHTPDSLENVLRAARELADGRVIAVFGAGGDRDRGKRPLMGEIGARLADVCLITSDNPRSEDPEEIIAEVLAGAGDAPGVEHDADRRASIHRAIALAADGDVVVIAGKGHEQGQEFAGGRKEPFDDVAVAREALRAAARA